MNTHFIADPHFGHEKIITLAKRPFNSIDEHDEYLISQINENVERNDRLIIVGDVGFHPQKYRMRIRCKEVILVYGNHDKRTYKDCFSRAVDVMTVKSYGLPIWISHYPHIFWPGSHHGHGHVYGHVHDAREEYLDDLFPERRSMDVGVDSARRILGVMRPFHESEVVEIFLERIGHDLLDFYRQHDEHKQMYQVDSKNQIVVEDPSLETRPALRKEVMSWMRNRSTP